MLAVPDQLKAINNRLYVSDVLERCYQRQIEDIHRKQRENELEWGKCKKDIEELISKEIIYSFVILTKEESEGDFLVGGMRASIPNIFKTEIQAEIIQGIGCVSVSNPISKEFKNWKMYQKFSGPTNVVTSDEKIEIHGHVRAFTHVWIFIGDKCIYESQYMMPQKEKLKHVKMCLEKVRLFNNRPLTLRESRLPVLCQGKYSKDILEYLRSDNQSKLVFRIDDQKRLVIQKRQVEEKYSYSYIGWQGMFTINQSGVRRITLQIVFFDDSHKYTRPKISERHYLCVPNRMTWKEMMLALQKQIDESL